MAQKNKGKDRKSILDRLVAPLQETFGLTEGMALLAVVMTFLVLFAAVFWFFYSEPPHTIVITTGPVSSMFETNAYKYRESKTFTNKHVKEKLRILPSKGSRENLDRLSDPNFKVDVGFVQGGITNSNYMAKLVSLGSVSYEPLWVFYRSGTPAALLSEFKGRKIAIGPEGSGTRSLAIDLLALNDVTTANSTFLDFDAEPAADALMNGKADLAFMMGDSASSQITRELLHTPDIQIFDFTQADGYARRIPYLNKLILPKGSLDFGKNIPSHDVTLVGPTVELIARADLHPALIDLLWDAMREVHGGKKLLQRKGEFPTPVDHDNIAVSAETTRYEKSGKTFLYKYLPFGLAGLLTRILVAFVPALVILIPALKLIPAVYKWRLRMRLYRWYRAMLAVERDVQQSPMSKGQHDKLQEKVTEIEANVNQMKVPASFADQYYALRTYVVFVRQQLTQKVVEK
jgi:TRAP-type uncharacterized transport system substrate-binding protein